MNTENTNRSQLNLLTAIRTHPGKTAHEYADICMLGVLSVKNQIEHLLRENLITNQHKKADPVTGELFCVYFPVFRLPEVVVAKQSIEDMQKVIDALAQDNERLRAELLEARKIQYPKGKR